MKVKLFAALTATLLPITASAASDAPKRLQTAAAAFKEVMGIPDKAIPQELLEKAECIVIIPDLKKLELLDLSRNELTAEGIARLRGTGVNLRCDDQHAVGSNEYLTEGDSE